MNRTLTSPLNARANTSGDLLQRRCACGNHAAGMCESCRKAGQGRLQVADSADRSEQEADRMADRALAAGAGGVRLQRRAGAAAAGGETAPASVERALAGAGRSLEPGVRRDMEQRFGHDFARVRVHSGTAAERSARDVSAEAYTVGSDIVFGAGRYAPAIPDGRRLLAHELAHVVQQGGAPGLLQRKPEAGGKGTPQPSEKEKNARSFVDGVIWMLSFSAWQYRSGQLLEHPERFPNSLNKDLEVMRYWFLQARSRVTSELGDDKSLQQKLIDHYRTYVYTTIVAFEAKDKQPAWKLYQANKDVIHELAGPPPAGKAKPKAYEPDALDQVAIPALKNLLCRTRQTGLEHCGNIIKTADGSLRVTGPHRGEVGICNAQDAIRQDESRVGYYHSHPEGQGLGFSKPGMNGRTVGDTESAEDNRIDYYLINSKGDMLRYIPSRDEYRNGRHVDLGPSGQTCQE
jgi:hypothetical protein